MAPDPEKVLSEFLDFCDTFMEVKDMKILIMKRFEACDDTFKYSNQFKDLIAITRAKMETDKSRPFVYLRDFLNELKAYNHAKEKKSSKMKRKRKKESSHSDTESLPLKSFKAASVHYESDSCIDRENDKSEQTQVNTKTIQKTLESKKTETSEGYAAICHEKNNLDPRNKNGVTQDSEHEERKNKLAQSSPPNTHSPLSIEAISLPSSSRCSSTVIDLDPTDIPQKALCEMNEHNAQTSKKNLNRTFCNNFEEFLRNQESAPSPTGSETYRNVENGLGSSATSDTQVKDKKGQNADRSVKRLENLLEKIRNKIERIQAKELSLDDLNDEASAYIFEDKLQQKFVKVWNKLCQAKGRESSTGRPSERKFRYQGTRYNEINRRIERFVNKTKVFPDFSDIQNLIQKVNTHRHLALGSNAVDSLARECFLDIGNKLQERRHEDFISTFGSSLTDNFSPHADPAIYDLELRKKLEDNKKLSKTKLDEILDKYSMKQDEIGEKPEEVPSNTFESATESNTEAEEKDTKAADETLTLEIEDDDEEEMSEVILEYVINSSEDEAQDVSLLRNVQSQESPCSFEDTLGALKSTSVINQSQVSPSSPDHCGRTLVDNRLHCESLTAGVSNCNDTSQCNFLITNVVSIPEEIHKFSNSDYCGKEESDSIEIIDIDSERLEEDNSQNHIETSDDMYSNEPTNTETVLILNEDSTEVERKHDSTEEERKQSPVSFQSLDCHQRKKVLISGLNRLKDIPLRSKMKDVDTNSSGGYSGVEELIDITDGPHPPPSQENVSNSSGRYSGVEELIDGPHPPPSQENVSNSSGSYSVVEELIDITDGTHPPPSQENVSNSSGSYSVVEELIDITDGTHPPPSQENVSKHLVDDDVLIILSDDD